MKHVHLCGVVLVLCDCVNILCIPDMNIMVVDGVCVCVCVCVCMASSRKLVLVTCVCHQVLMPTLTAGCKVLKVDLLREHARLVQGKPNLWLSIYSLPGAVLKTFPYINVYYYYYYYYTNICTNN
jgi:hypothetical protein